MPLTMPGIVQIDQDALSGIIINDPRLGQVTVRAAALSCRYLIPSLYHKLHSHSADEHEENCFMCA